MLKIVTYNINGLRQRISQFGSLLKLLNSLDADIICFQETKITRQEVTADLIMAEGYETFFSCTRTSGKGRTGYSGVATFCRVKSAFSSTEVALPVTAEEGFTGLLRAESRSANLFAEMDFLEEYERDELLKIDNEGRCVITDHGHFVLFNVYGPRADPEDVERTHFKTDFYKIMQKRWELVQQQKRRIVVVGDLNIAPSAIDRCDAGPDFENNEFRRWLRSMLVRNGGFFFDIFRQKHPERKDAYTHWSVHNGAEEFNYGSRIDHMLASGGCLHNVDNNECHNLVACHVDECDIMTQFRRWKPGSSRRWKGGRSTKLEGSDHVPVFFTLKEIPDIHLHSTPALSARYMPEIRGSQQTIVSVLMKRRMSERVDVSMVTSQASEEDSKNVNSVENVNGLLHSCSVANNHSMIDACEYAPSASMDMQDSSTAGHMLTGAAPDARKKKKMKQTIKSQLSLTSFFQKVSSSHGNVDKSIRISSDCQENVIDRWDKSKEIPDDDNEENILKSSPDNEQKVLTASGSENEKMSSNDDKKGWSASGSENGKKTVALVEWQRIQQLMQDSIPLCGGHHEPCVSRVVKKPGPNFGRRFYVCARAEGPSSNPETRCDFFRWAGSKSKQKK